MLEQLGDGLQQFLENRSFGTRKPSGAIRAKLCRAYSDQFAGVLKLGQLNILCREKVLTSRVA